jgi:predicted permease
VAFFVFAPCLIYDIIVSNAVPGDDLMRMIAFALAANLGLGAVAAIVGRVLGWARPLTAAVVLVVLLPNAGNYGLSASLFAFGDEGLAQAGVYFVTSAILTFTAGVFVASLGRASLGTALVGLIRVPTIWAVALALVSTSTGWMLPFPLERTVDLLSQASIPTFLVILGMQLRGRGINGPALPVAFSTAMRLLGGCLAGLALAPLFGLEGVARQAGILQSAMPSAIICIVIATEYDAEPAFATSVVFLTTLLSPLTLTPLLAYLGA